MIYVALLCGINVGGKNKIKMAELRYFLETIGLNRVQSYIQSGNILFESNEKEEALQKQIEKKIEGGFGFSINVILRTATELERIIGNCPFSEKTISEAEASAVGESLYVALLSRPPSHEGIKRLSSYKNEKETYLIEGREIYLLFHHSIQNSNLAKSLQKLGVTVTIRNWKTLSKIGAMVNERNI
ncbi:DUF1697 domain-containing protein [Virgibacillus sp. L01]|uniref:DUF1697 domain-containing protein n=1 Tax=Virgibacillus sp. L01 TaxID=3457429 RepID=UPI003FD60D8E